MKMRTSWKKDKHGDMGVGTMIIFIAMVLVAAVAASVLISTANKVREQAQNTGDQAINNVASGFVVQDVTGTVDPTFATMTDLTIQMRLQAGSPNMNMDLVSIQFVSGTSNQMLSFVAGSTAAAGGAVADQLLSEHHEHQRMERWKPRCSAGRHDHRDHHWPDPVVLGGCDGQDRPGIRNVHPDQLRDPVLLQHGIREPEVRRCQL